MRDCEDKNLEELQKLSLEEKIKISKMRIIEFVEYMNQKVYISFSGGKDSTVLLHLVRSIYPEIGGVFCDTGLEYPEIKDFIKIQENITTIRPKISFIEVLDRYGWPIISKEQSQYIGQCQSTKSLSVLEYRLNGRGPNKTSGKISKKWQYLLNAPFKINDKCCSVMKKAPFKKYEKETGLKPIIGTMTEESTLRKQQWLKSGCNVFDGDRQSSRPISFWTEKDVWDYINLYNLEVADIYNKGAKRTGCIFCLYGYHFDTAEDNRLELLKNTHPKLYDYCMNKLGMKKVLEWYPERKQEEIIEKMEEE